MPYKKLFAVGNGW